MPGPTAQAKAARAWADAAREASLQRGESFVSETVFSHPSKLDLMQKAQAAGFEVALYVVCLDEPHALLERVRQRVREGGHAVPANKVLARYPRTLFNLAHAVRIANLSMLFHAAETSEGGPVLVATVAAGQITAHTRNLPTWARRVLSPSG